MEVFVAAEQVKVLMTASLSIIFVIAVIFFSFF